MWRSRILAACDRLNLREAREFITQENVLAKGAPDTSVLAPTDLRIASDGLVQRFKLRRSEIGESRFRQVSLEQQHYDLVDWGARILRPHLQAVTRPTSIRGWSLVSESEPLTENSRDRDKLLRQYRQRAIREANADAATAILIQIVAKHTIRSRLDRSEIRDDVYDALNVLLGVTSREGVITPTQVADWCRTLEEVLDIPGSPQLPSAFHAFAHETWEFYGALLGLEPTIDVNETGRMTAYHSWSEAVASLVFPKLDGTDWETAIRTRGAGPGREFLSRKDIAAVRWTKLPWTRPSTAAPGGGTDGGTPDS